MANIVDEIVRRVFRAHRETHFLATVATYSAGPPPTATITRNGQTTADAESYPVADEVAALVATDTVVVLDVTGEGGYVIIHKIP